MYNTHNNTTNGGGDFTNYLKPQVGDGVLNN